MSLTVALMWSHFVMSLTPGNDHPDRLSVLLALVSAAGSPFKRCRRRPAPWRGGARRRGVVSRADVQGSRRGVRGLLARGLRAARAAPPAPNAALPWGEKS